MHDRRGSRFARRPTVAWATFARAAIGEVGRVLVVIRGRWRERRILGFAATILLCGCILAGRLLDYHRPGELWIDDCCAEQDSYPLLTWLGRMPGSVIAPAHDLPVWGSVIQVLVVVGLSEAAFGVRRTVLVGAAGHFVATVGARILLALGPGSLVGLPTIDGRLSDTGPSAVTVALTAYLAVALRCPVLGTLAGVGIATSAFLHSDLAGREHVLAWLVGMACGALQLVALRQRAQRIADRLDDMDVLVRP